MWQKITWPLNLQHITDTEMVNLIPTANEWDMYWNSTQNFEVVFNGTEWRSLDDSLVYIILLNEDRESWNFTTNGWITANDWTNDWYVWTTNPKDWTYSAYISDDSWTSNAYTNTSQVSHLFVDIDIPAGATQVLLNFDVLCNWENWYDYLEIFTAPDTFTPTAWTVPSWTNVTSLWVIQWYTSFISYGLNLWTNFAGNTLRLIFSWKNDWSVWNNPPSNIDNLIIKYV